jgi:hypothetical protein
MIDTLEVLKYTYTKHLFYTEEIENYEVSFNYFIEVKKKFFETTLLDNLLLSAAKFDYRNLPSAITVRCSVFNAMASRYTPFKIAKYYAAVDLNSKYSGPREWKDFKYSSCIPRGKEEENTMIRFERYMQPPEERKQVELSKQAEEASIQPQTFEGIVRKKDIQLWCLGQGLQASTSRNSQVLLDHGTSDSKTPHFYL